jgi:hypothetical protein
LQAKLRQVFLRTALLLAVLAKTEAQDWYRSNPAGMALERIPSRMVALHYDWALSVERAGPGALPALLRTYYNSAWSLEQRLLYERGMLKRRQWIFRDSSGTTRLNASLPSDLASIGKPENEEIPPFIEIFGSTRFLTEIYQYLAAGVYATRYSYQEGLLIRADAFLDNKALWTDQYRYTRSFILRGVERRYHEAGAATAAVQGQSNLPPVSLDVRDAPPIPGFVSPSAPYDTSIMTEVLGEIYSIPAGRVVFDMDSQGRVLTETRYDAEDSIIAVITNEWSGDRISTIRWTAGSVQGRIVFTYSGGDRIAEEDYKNGVLERTVRLQGDEEIEEIYMNGKPILRAVWKERRKISEERLR